MTEPAVFATSAENRVVRIAERASYDKATVFAILDAGYFCHIGFVANGKPIVMPMTYWREGEYVYFHSANKGRFADACANAEICITVTHFDGLVLGHSAMNHSYNYRSVVMHGKPEIITDHAEKIAAMQAFVEHVLPQRFAQVRGIKDNEARAITLLRLKLDQVSAKVRDEFPDAEEVSPDWPAWIGVIPARTTFLPPVADPTRNKIAEVPDNISQFRGRDQHQPGYLEPT
jgi:nitroimidazol reductase NimA-like FMN-containing flavoprotein (pyridoxamine 5'-phosphate oxidase superfamily)